ncbi:MAG: carboxypeptidase-like regulatory domain-containing protein, partial [Flavobacterium sp.]
MLLKNIILVFFVGLFSLTISAQKARVKGVVLDEFNNPVENVTITVGDKVSVSNENGFYSIEIDANKKVTLFFSHVSLKKKSIDITLKPNEDYELNPLMNSKVEEFGEVIITANSKKRIEGVTTIDPVIIRRIPGANAGIENIVKTLPGFNSNNELSTSYAVRGGNYDENLVYVNEIEVYRPFLIRSGQQEGLSFT